MNAETIIIIDEVDTFFDKSFYGATLNPSAKYRSDEVNNILKYVWELGKPRGNGAART